MGLLLLDLDLMVKTAMAIEREVDDALNIQEASIKDKLIRCVKVVSLRSRGFYSLWTLGLWTCRRLTSCLGWTG